MADKNDFFAAAAALHKAEKAAKGTPAEKHLKELHEIAWRFVVRRRRDEGFTNNDFTVMSGGTNKDQ